VTKQELKKSLFDGRLWNPPYRKDHPTWIEAFEAYKRETGDDSVNLRCGMCFNKVKKWLER
jgi:hypothetical protein